MRRSSRHRPSWASRISGGLLWLAVLWLLGFVFFLASLPQPQQNNKLNNEKFDAIVVLTGGSERLKEGLRLLMEERGERLFISGVKPGITEEQLLASIEGLDRSNPILNEIVLGYEAGNTIGNAEETGYWLAEKGYSKIILVTANYHMKRALLEFRSLLPWVDIYPFAVYPQEMLDLYWWAKPKTIWLLLYEYHKFGGALLRQLWLKV